jgi:hypothetical protein
VPQTLIGSIRYWKSLDHKGCPNQPSPASSTWFHLDLMMSLIQILHRNQHLPEIFQDYKGGPSAWLIQLLK